MTTNNPNHNSPSQTPQRSILKQFMIFASCVIVIVIIALLFKPLRNELARHRQAIHAADKIKNLGGRVSWNPKMEIIETIVRDKALSRITDVRFFNPTFPDEEWLVLQEIPQRFGLQVSGSRFTDNSLEYLKEVRHLDYLVIKNTGVSDKGIADLQNSLPYLTVMYGYPIILPENWALI